MLRLLPWRGRTAAGGGEGGPGEARRLCSPPPEPRHAAARACPQGPGSGIGFWPDLALTRLDPRASNASIRSLEAGRRTWTLFRLWTTCHRHSGSARLRAWRSVQSSIWCLVSW